MRHKSTRRWQRRHRRSAYWLLGFLAAFQLALGVLVETALPGVRDPEHQERLEKLQARLQAQPDKPLWLMLGSSRTGQAFAARHFELLAQEKINAFNFGIPASGPIMQAIVWQRLIDQGIRPQHLILEVLPAQFNGACGSPSEAKMLDAARLTFRELSLAREDLPNTGDIWRKWLIGRLIPTWRHQAELRDATRLDVAQYYTPDNVPPVDDHGWQPRDTALEIRDAVRQLAHSQYDRYYAAFEPLPGATAALQTVLNGAHQLNISVTLLLMPEGTEFRNLTTPAAEERLQSFLHSLIEDTSVELLDGRDWLADEDFYDMHHVHPVGGVHFTERLFKEESRNIP